MSLEMRLELKLAQKLVMTPQLQQAIKLLQLSRLEMSQLIQQEMLENPVLEEVQIEDERDEMEARTSEEAPAAGEEDEAGTPEIDVFDMKWDNYLDADADRDPESYSDLPDEGISYEQTLSNTPTLADHLIWQLNLTATGGITRRLGEIIIGNIDDDGYLRDVTVHDICAIAKVPAEKVEEALGIVQEFDPPGVGARNLQECLLIQARQLGLGGTLVEDILANHMGALEKKRYPSIARSLRVPVGEVVVAAGAIESLEPKPGRPFSASEVQYIIPDVYVVKKGDDYVILLNDEGLPKLRISQFYKKVMRSGGDEATREYIESKLRSARWLLKSIEQRNRTIFRVTESIVNRQREFLDRGAGYIKPMILKDVASDIEMHESTISRVTTNKFMHTPQGIFELKYFFASGIACDNGEDLSSITVRNLIEKTIREEDPKKPLNDRVIVDMLKHKNINIARRTVAKYRCEMKIPPANMRKKP